MAGLNGCTKASYWSTVSMEHPKSFLETTSLVPNFDRKFFASLRKVEWR